MAKRDYKFVCNNVEILLSNYFWVGSSSISHRRLPKRFDLGSRVNAVDVFSDPKMDLRDIYRRRLHVFIFRLLRFFDLFLFPHCCRDRRGLLNCHRKRVFYPSL